MTTKHFVIATAGHVDHGKSALVQALTGTDPDRLPEEKARGVTIDLGFAHTRLQSPDGSTAFQLGIVDVPGHEDFVRNMVAGVGSIDLALIVVAADDGWMPQTEEHLQILEYLGVPRAVVVLSKADLLSDDAVARTEQIRERLQGSRFAASIIVPVSVSNGSGLPELRRVLAATLAELPGQPDIGKPRLAVDRVFSLRGIGTVVTGSLTGGVLRRGQAVCVQPAGRVTRLRGIQNANQDVEFCYPGMRTALNLPDLQVSSRAEVVPEEKSIRRGDVVTIEGLGQASLTWNVLLGRSARPEAGTRVLRHGTRVRIHFGSTRAAARVLHMSERDLGPGESDLAQVRFEVPVFAFCGDRFVLRDWAEEETLAGGIVLEPSAQTREFRSPEQRRFLEQRASDPDSVLAYAGSQILRDKAVPRDGFLAQSRFSESAVEDAVTALICDGKVIGAASVLLDARWWKDLLGSVAASVDNFHREHPESLGFSIREIDSELERRLAASSAKSVVQALRGYLLAQLCAQGFRQRGGAIARIDFRPTLPPHLMLAGARVRQLLNMEPLEPPAVKEIAPDAASAQALRFFLDTGEAIEISPELVLSTRAYIQAVERIRATLQRRGPSTVSELKQALGTSRRIMVPLLEKLDREGMTFRVGDRRHLPASSGKKEANAEIVGRIS